MKKLLSLFLTLCMLLSVVSVMVVTVNAADAAVLTPDTAWYDNHQGDTDLYIGTPAELLGLSKLISQQLRANGDQSDFDTIDASRKIFVGKTVHITADIDLNPGWDATKGTAPTNKWLAGNYTCFTGMIDGGGHTISGIYLSTAENHTGIFGNAKGGTEANPVGVKNLTIKNSYITSTANLLGGLFGAVPSAETNKGRYFLIENVTTEITIVGGTTEVGGIFGYLTIGNHVTIKNCNLKNTLTGSTGANISGVIGKIEGGTVDISDTYVNSKIVSVGDQTAGMVGFIGDGTVTVSNCYLDNEIQNAATKNNGGVVGKIGNGILNIQNVVVDGTMTSNGARPTGGFIGETAAGSTVTITNSLFSGINNSLNNWNGGFIGIANGPVKVEKCISAGVLTPASWTTDFNASGAIMGLAHHANTQVNNCLYTDIYYVVSGKYVLGESMCGLNSTNKTVKNDSDIHVTSEEITGLAAQEKLTAAGLTDWTVTTNGLPLPRSIVKTFGKMLLTKPDSAETTVTDLAGYQTTAVAGDKFDLRLVGTLKLAEDNKTETNGKVSDYTAVGFRVVANYGDTTKAKDYTTDTVYNSVAGYENNGTDVLTYTAESLGADYLFVLVCNNVPANAGIITMEVTTYYTMADGTAVSGATYVLAVDPATSALS